MAGSGVGEGGFGGHAGSAGSSSGMAGVGGFGTCNALANTAPAATFTSSASGPPEPQIGGLESGTYYWTSTTYFGGTQTCIDAVAALDIHYTVEVTGSPSSFGFFQVAFSTTHGTTTSSGQFRVSGSAMQLQADCISELTEASMLVMSKGPFSTGTSSLTRYENGLAIMRDRADGCGTAVHALRRR